MSGTSRAAQRWRPSEFWHVAKSPVLASPLQPLQLPKIPYLLQPPLYTSADGAIHFLLRKSVIERMDHHVHPAAAECSRLYLWARRDLRYFAQPKHELWILPRRHSMDQHRASCKRPCHRPLLTAVRIRLTLSSPERRTSEYTNRLTPTISSSHRKPTMRSSLLPYHG